MVANLQLAVDIGRRSTDCTACGRGNSDQIAWSGRPLTWTGASTTRTILNRSGYWSSHSRNSSTSIESISHGERTISRQPTTSRTFVHSIEATRTLVHSPGRITHTTARRKVVRWYRKSPNVFVEAKTAIRRGDTTTTTIVGQHHLRGLSDHAASLRITSWGLSGPRRRCNSSKYRRRCRIFGLFDDNGVVTFMTTFIRHRTSQLLLMAHARLLVLDISDATGRCRL